MYRPLVALAGAVCLCAAPLRGEAAEPPPLKLPAGARARVFTRDANRKIEGRLVSADSATITLAPRGSHPLAQEESSIATTDIVKMDVALDRKRHGWQGLLIGAALGVLLGVADEVDPVACEANSYIACSRAEAIALDAGGGAILGLGIGLLVTSDRWTPVALDTLGPPVSQRSDGGRLRPVVQVAIRF